MIDLSDEVYTFVRTVLEVRKSDGNDEIINSLKKQALDSLLNYNRFKQHRGQKESLIQAVMLMDDVRAILRLCVDLKIIDFDAYQNLKELSSKIVKRLVCEKNIILGSSKAVAERSLGR